VATLQGAKVAEYVDYAEYYDFDHSSSIDIAFYLDFARQCGAPVLELACGTGRVLVPLAEAGFEVWGVDRSENMLARCREKVEKGGLAERVHLILADMARFELPRKGFSLCFIAVRSFMHLFTQADQLSCLGRVFDHLRPGSLLIIDVYAPNLHRLAQDSAGPFMVRREFDLPNGHHVIRRDRFVGNDLVQQISHSEIRFEEYDRAGRLVRERTVPMDTRYTFRFELQLLLERSGFEVLELYRDYDRNPYDGTGEIIAVSRRP